MTSRRQIRQRRRELERIANVDSMPALCRDCFAVDLPLDDNGRCSECAALKEQTP